MVDPAITQLASDRRRVAQAAKPRPSSCWPGAPRLARGLGCLVLCVSGVLGWGGARPARAAAPCTEELTVDWRFNAAAPITEAPALSNQGGVVIGSVDGYVHALGPTGHFQWSYTLDAGPAGLAVGADGRTYALSREGALHVLLPGGQYQWGARLPAGMLPTGPLAHSERGVVFVPSELNLYAFSSSSGLLWRAFVGSKIVSGPVLGPEGSAWIATRSGRVLRIRTPQDRDEFDVAGEGELELVQAGEHSVLVRQVRVDSSVLLAFDDRGQLAWKRADVGRASQDGAILRGSGKAAALWSWIDPRSGAQMGERELALDDSAEPSRLGEYAVVPTDSGRVYLFGKDGAVHWCQIATAPLLRVAVHGDAGHVVAASGDGWVASVRFRARQRHSSRANARKRSGVTLQ